MNIQAVTVPGMLTNDSTSSLFSICPLLLRFKLETNVAQINILRNCEGSVGLSEIDIGT